MKQNDVRFEACAHDAKRLSIEPVLKCLDYIRRKIRDLAQQKRLPKRVARIVSLGWQAGGQKGFAADAQNLFACNTEILDFDDTRGIPSDQPLTISLDSRLRSSE